MVRVPRCEVASGTAHRQECLCHWGGADGLSAPSSFGGHGNAVPLLSEKAKAKSRRDAGGTNG